MYAAAKNATFRCAISFNIRSTERFAPPCLLHLSNLTSLAHILMHNDAGIKITLAPSQASGSCQDVCAENATSEIIPHGLSDDGGLIESTW